MGYKNIVSITYQMENVLDRFEINLNENDNVIDIMANAVGTIKQIAKSMRLGGSGTKDVSHLMTQLENTQAQKSKLASQTCTILSLTSEEGCTAYRVAIQLSEASGLQAARICIVFKVLRNLGEIAKSSRPMEELENERFVSGFSVVLLSKEKAAIIKEKLLQVSEVETVQVRVISSTSQKEETATALSSFDFSNPLHVNRNHIEHLLALFEELVVDCGRLEDLSQEIEEGELDEALERIARSSQELKSSLLIVKMVPVEDVFNRFPKKVRELAKQLNKQIHLEIFEAKLEIDRSAVVGLANALVQLIHNSIVHGIETPTARREAGKPPVGKIILRAYQDTDNVCIEVGDDGTGINRNKTIQKVIESSVVMPFEEIDSFIFMPGFSTTAERGIGLDIVRTTIQSLRGRITVESTAGEGSKFLIQLPITLSNLSVLLVKVGKEIYAIPRASVLDTILLSEEESMTAHTHEAMDYQGKDIPLVFLQKIFNQSNEKEKHNNDAIVVIREGVKRLGLVVDKLLGQRKVILKPLGDYLKNMFALSSATILDDGKVALIIDPHVLLNG